uniref:DUF659 domain-containing protein n=1 Tax=Phaseolus vulgaris TaxID=3885 RepID=V7BPH1_PHAVU|nr:hypothetical protein PHAVU_006G162300g [Phaseolus vulgaris]ESW19869.1 hypothetical protein PHAVU_006G162300g [Phaseolus vulgaris]
MQILCKVLTAGVYSFKHHLEGNQKEVLPKACLMNKFFNKNVIPFHVAMSKVFGRMLDLVSKHGPRFKYPLYHKISIKYLEEEVQTTKSASEFWKNIVICLKGAFPLIQVVRMVDSKEKPAMERIEKEFSGVNYYSNLKYSSRASYEDEWNIIDERWDSQLHGPFHTVGYFLNPELHYVRNFKVDTEVKIDLLQCIKKMVVDPKE